MPQFVFNRGILLELSYSGSVLKLRRKFLILVRNFKSYILDLRMILAWFMVNKTRAKSHTGLV